MRRNKNTKMKFQLFGNSEQLKLLQDKALGIVGATAKGGRSEGMEPKGGTPESPTPR